LEKTKSEQNDKRRTEKNNEKRGGRMTARKETKRVLYIHCFNKGGMSAFFKVIKRKNLLEKPEIL
jgi:uncharacterized protein YjhX (UPF0386 family)